MKRRTLAFAIGMMVMLLPAFVTAQSPLEGNWQHVEYSYESKDTSFTWTNLQPSIYIFGEKYYSMMMIHGEEARPLVPDGLGMRSLDRDQLLSIVLPLTANSGTYEIDGNSFTIDPIVAMWPNFMESGTWTFTFEMRDGYLWLTRNFNEHAKGVFKLERLN